MSRWREMDVMQCRNVHFMILVLFINSHKKIIIMSNVRAHYKQTVQVIGISLFNRYHLIGIE